ncbi:MAG TPA: SGNH/GDSL hydrolase family protein [Candidatus Sulfotelmatobacter sp.]|nr:SGNH/GDSL hydrolase family protein [Candidatus Sulfotelmatobacter sp.]
MRSKLAVALLVFAGAAAGGYAQSAGTSSDWVGSWAASQQIPEPQNSIAPEEMQDVTLRQIFHLSVGGSTLRVRLSNAFGSQPLHFTSVHIARPLSLSSPRIDSATDRALSFSGEPDVTVPAGAEYFSDPVAFPAAPLSSVAVTFHLDKAPVGETGHPGSRATSYYVRGDHVAAADLPDAKRVDHWYQISGIDACDPNDAAIVVLGDSITDGHGASTNGDNRWTDVLAERLQGSSATREFGVLNEGIGGNHLLTDGLGPNALARFDRDVLAQTGVRYLIVLEGVNDLGGLTREGDVAPAAHSKLVHRILAAYEQIILRAHANGVRVFGATILPFVGSEYYHPPHSTEVDRETINDWIRAPGHFDGVIDFDKLMRDPQQPDRLLPAYDSGDHLHPSVAGYRAMGEAVPLTLFTNPSIQK